MEVIQKLKVIPINEYIEHHLNGGTYKPSREAMALLSIDPIKGQVFMRRESEDRKQLAVKCAISLHKKRNGNSKYLPHQGKQECARRNKAKILGR